MVGVIVIGDEVLRAQVEELNSYRIIKHLLSVGHHVGEIRVIPDDVKRIAHTVSEFVNEYEYVISTGGVGPTHDDVTMKGSAKGLKVGLALHQEMYAFLCKRYEESSWPSVKKMAMLPEGSEIIIPSQGTWPIIRCDNLFFLPGLPSVLEEKLFVLKTLLPLLPATWQAALFLDIPEHLIAQDLAHFQERYPCVLVGSYPVSGNSDWKVKITFTSQKKEEISTLFAQAEKMFQRCFVKRQVPEVLQ